MNNTGHMTVVAGPMRSGKTLYLILDADQSEVRGMPTFIFYPSGAERWGYVRSVSSRIATGADGVSERLSYPAISVSRNADEILSMIPSDKQCFVGFDDAQFFTSKIVDVVRKLRMDGHKVFIAGVDMDCFLQPFGPMPYLMSLADEVIKRTAVCVDCKEPAQLTYRLLKSNVQEIVGDNEYIPVCYDCYKFRTSKSD